MQSITLINITINYAFQFNRTLNGLVATIDSSKTFL